MKDRMTLTEGVITFSRWKNKLVILVAFSAIMSLIPHFSTASHNMGANLTFECISNCVIRVHLRAYRDCSGITGMSKNVIFTGNGPGCNQPVAVNNWTAWSIVEVTPLCASTTTRCTNSSASLNGVQEYYAYRDYNICGLNCNTYTMSWYDCCRNGAITSGAGGGIWVSSTLNANITPCNSSPQFTNPPIPYICAGQPFTFNQGAWDPDGDSLSYRFGPCNTSASATVNYNAGYSFTQPLGTSWNVTINAINGDITITPNPAGNIVVGVFCVYVDEWRNGILINTIERDIQTTVINCGANNVPTVTGISNLTGGSAVGNVITTCIGSTVNFNVNSTDPDGGQTETMSWNQNIVGASFYQCGNAAVQNTIVANNPCGTFNWTPGATGTYFFTVTIQDDACPIVGTNQYTYTINVGNMQVTVADSVPGCISSDAYYCVTPTNGVAPFGFTWTGGGNLTTNPNATDSCLVHSYPGPGTYNYSVTVSDAFGCNVTNNGSVIIDFVLPVITGPTDICTSNPAATYSTPNVVGNTYVWTISAGGSISGGQGTNSVNVVWSGSGPDTIRVMESNPINCDSTVELLVNVHPNPTPLISGPGNVCEFSAGHVYSVPASANGFVWSIIAGNGVITSGAGTNSITVKWLGTAPGVIQLVETDAFSCAGTTTIGVNVNAKPYPLISGPASVCELTAGHTYSTPNNAGNTYTWTISSGNGVITSGQGSNSIDVKWTASGNYSITLVEANSQPCDSTVSFNVTVDPKPAPVISGNLTPCAFTSGYVYSTPNTAGNTYLWAVTGSGSIVAGGTSNSVTVDWGAAGTGNLSLTQTDGSCDSTVTVPVGVLPRPNPVITGPDTVCEFTSGHTYTVANTFGSSWNWTISAGNGVISSGQGSNSISIKWLGSAAGIVSVTETAISTCDTTVTFNVTVNPKPYPAIAGPATACEFTSGHTYSVAGAAGNAFNWTITAGNGQITSGQGSNSIDIKWLANSAGTVQVLQTNADGCDSTVTFNVTVNPKPYPSISGQLAPCAFTTGHVYSVSNNPGNTYTWTVTGSGTITAGQATNSVTIDWGASGAATLTLLETAGGCDSTVSVNVNVSGNPNPVISGPTPICEYTAAHTYSTSNNAGSAYVWTVPAAGVIQSGQGTNSINVKWFASGTYTISVMETLGAGCDTTVTFSVTVDPKPYPVISGPDPVCEFTDGHTYSITGAAGNQYLWTITAGPGLIYNGQGTNSIDVKWMTNGAGTVQVMETNSSSCDSTVTFNVTVDAKPYPVIAGNVQVCEYTTETYILPNTPGSSWTWGLSGPGNIVSGQNTNSISVKWGANGPGTVSVLETNSAGCDSLVTINVSINSKPYPLISGPNTACEYTGGHTYTSTNNAGNTYSWSVIGAGVISSGQGTNSIDVKWMGNGSYTVQLVEANAAGCDSTVTFGVTVNPKPYPLIAGPAVVCEYTNGHSYSVTGAMGNAYLWAVTSGSGVIYSGQGTNSIDVKWGSNGPGVIEVLETNSFSCDSLVSFNITVDPKPYPVISGPGTICEYTNGHNYTIAASLGSSYNWSIGSGSGGGITSGQGSNTISIQWQGTGIDTLWVTHTNAQGCDSTVFFPITIDPKPYPVISGPLAACEYTDGHTYSIPLNPGSSYNWTITQGNGNIYTTQTNSSVEIKWLANGPAIVQVIETNSFGCDSTVTFNVTVNPKPYPSISGPLTVCENTSIHQYTAVNVAGMNYAWKVNGGSILGSNSGNTVNVSWGNFGSGIVELTATNPVTACDSTVSINITINPAPIPSVQGPASICAYSNSITYNTLQNAGNSYSWTIIPGVIVSGQSSSTTVVNWAFGTGNGTISVVETNGFGCSALDIFNVDLLPAPAPDIDGPIEVCQNVTHYYQTPAQFNNRYVWSIPPNSGIIVNGQGSNLVGIYWTLPGSPRTLTLYQQDTLSGCDTVMTLDVEVFPAIFADIEPDTAIGCDPFLVEFDGTQTPGATSWKWFFGDGFVSLQSGIGHLYQGAGIYTPTLMVENSYGCKDSVDGYVEVLPSPTADFQVIYPNNKDFFYITTDTFSAVNLSMGAVNYLWDYGDGNTDTSFIPWHVYGIDGEMVIRLTATAANGCSDSREETILVKVIDDVWIPTAFSPNDDGLNDEFRIVAHNLQNFYIAIFDRWGKMIYESNDPNFGWKGFFQGQRVQEGVYTYMIQGTKFKGETFKKGGTVTLVR